MDVYIAALLITLKTYWMFALGFFASFWLIIPTLSRWLIRFDWYNNNFSSFQDGGVSYTRGFKKGLINVVVFILLMTALKIAAGP